MSESYGRFYVGGEAGAKLGTFGGVFTPSILTILGIILFLRLGFVVGGVGLERALLIIAAANAISILTSLSVAGVTSNLKIKGGGDYYLISRTLGISYGGAIGLVLFLAKAIEIGFYSIGFGEALAALLGFQSSLAMQVMAAEGASAVAAAASSQVQEPNPVTHYDFEDDQVEGDLQRPDGELISSVSRAKQPSLIEIRRDFIPEILKMIDDL